MNTKPSNGSLEALHFDNKFTRELPADQETRNQRRQVINACFSQVRPTKVASPSLVTYSKEVAKLLDLTEETCESEQFAQVFTGNLLLPQMDPHATCYGGHQFGTWAGQLGDGRAINLGEVINQKGKRWILQLKGAGPTPYSRNADGLAVLRSSVREFLCSEAMYHLGVPTTRALSLTLTGEQVIRDMFYDGNPKAEPGAVVCRVAPSFTRFGHFQIFAARGEIDTLQQFLDYTLRTDFPHLGSPSVAVYVKWFAEICRRTAEMIVHWQRVGFVHGVMNTDNMSVLGLTIDYGPYGWLEDYDPHWTPNTTDQEERRYRFGHQPQIALWNLVQLANAIYPLIDQVEPLQQALQVYNTGFAQGWQTMMAQKLGLNSFVVETDVALIEELLAVLAAVETDMTLFFRKLASVNVGPGNPDEIGHDELLLPIIEAYYRPQQLTGEYKAKMVNWLRRYIKRIQKDGTTNEIRSSRMNAVNPKYVLRNYLAQQAIDKAELGDYSMVNELLEILRCPYAEQSEREVFAKKRPDWARTRAGCSMLSCSS